MIEDDQAETERTEPLTAIGGITERRAEALRQAGYGTMADLQAASREDLAAVEGISSPLAARIERHVSHAEGNSVGAGTGSSDADPGGSDPGPTDPGGADPGETGSRGSGPVDTGAVATGGGSRESTQGSRMAVEALILVLVVLGLLAAPDSAPKSLLILVVLAVVGLRVAARFGLEADLEALLTGDPVDGRNGGPGADLGGPSEHRDRIRVEPRSPGASRSGLEPHFEERLEPRVSYSTFGILALVAGVLLLPVVLVLVLAPPTVPSVGDLLADPSLLVSRELLYVALVVGGLLAWRSWATSEVLTRVTGDGIEIERANGRLREPTRVHLEFENVASVQFSEPTVPRIRVTEADRAKWGPGGRFRGGPPTFKVDRRTFSADLYPGGVRIEHTGGPPVYVGSERPLELATAIAKSAPDVDAVGRLDPRTDGGPAAGDRQRGRSG